MRDIFQIHQKAVIRQTDLLLRSYRYWLQRELVPDTGDPLLNARTLFQAPMVVISAGLDTDQLLTYGNETALRLWKMDWEVFCATPSRQTAEPMHREERAAFLAQVRRHGFIENYQGIRISSLGERFVIKQATVWNLLDEQGAYAGQAATFSQWAACS
jgi:hypothetical protein